MEWNLFFCLITSVIHTSYSTIGLNYDVAYVLKFIHLWAICGFSLSLLEFAMAVYILKVFYRRLILLNDELLACWAKITNVFVGLFFTIVQSRSRDFIEKVGYLTANDSPTFLKDFIIGTKTK